MEGDGCSVGSDGGFFWGLEVEYEVCVEGVEGVELMGLMGLMGLMDLTE